MRTDYEPHLRRATATRGWRLPLRAALAILWIAGGLDLEVAHGVAGRRPENQMSSGYAQAIVYSGNLRAALTTRATGTDSHRLILQLGEDNRPLLGRPVLLSVSRPLRARAKPELMRQSGTTYQAKISVESGIWELLLQFRDASARLRSIPFLLRVATGSHGGVWSIYALFVPVNGWSPAISIPLGSYIADVEAAIEPVGRARVRILLRPQTRHAQLPTQLRLDLTMLDMVMGQSYTVATRVRPGLYSAQVFFSMPGTWGIVLTTGRVSSTAALLIGVRTQGGRARRG